MIQRISVCVFSLLFACMSASAEDRISQVWTCTLTDGHTADELEAVHAKWVVWANAQPGGEGIRGSVATPAVGLDLTVVLMIDSYPSLAAMTADCEAYYGSDEGLALEAEYAELSTCTSNALWNVSSVAD